MRSSWRGQGEAKGGQGIFKEIDLVSRRALEALERGNEKSGGPKKQIKIGFFFDILILQGKVQNKEGKTHLRGKSERRHMKVIRAREKTESNSGTKTSKKQIINICRVS